MLLRASASPEQPTILAAGLTDPNLLSREARVILDGHTITDTDLSTIYGLDVAAAVLARLHRAGPRAARPTPSC